MASFVSQEDFNAFHMIDRKLFSLLVNLRRDPAESMEVIALWLWLERVGFRGVVHKILSLPYTLTNELADEAITCLNVINNDISDSLFEAITSDIPLTQSLITETNFLLQFFVKNRLIATQGVEIIRNEVCVRAFGDIMQPTLKQNATQSISDHSQQFVSNCYQQQQQHPMVQSGYPQMVFSLNPEIEQSFVRENEVPPDERTMFVTFSKGYTVFENEVREFFTRNYGDCIESFNMQEVVQNEQSLFARVVLQSASTVDMILNGKSKVKFAINGKHVWVRKFVPKRPKPSLPIGSPLKV